MKLGEMTWEEAGKALKNADFVVLPTGSFEQHGPHLPLLTDTIRADNLSEKLAKMGREKGMKILLLPTLPFGVSEHHMRFPGTISIEPGIYISLIENIGRCLAKHGAQRLVILNFHGGNLPCLEIAAAKIRSKYGLKTYVVHWTSYAREVIVKVLKPTAEWGHACEYETSIVLAFRPDLIRRDKIRKAASKKRPRVRSFYFFDEITESGGLGDPTKATAEKGRIIAVEGTKAIVKVLEEVLKLEGEA